MSISMETNTAAIYHRRSTEDDGKSVGQQERGLPTTGTNYASTSPALTAKTKMGRGSKRQRTARTDRRSFGGGNPYARLEEGRPDVFLDAHTFVGVHEQTVTAN